MLNLGVENRRISKKIVNYITKKCKNHSLNYEIRKEAKTKIFNNIIKLKQLQ